MANKMVGALVSVVLMGLVATGAWFSYQKKATEAGPAGSVKSVFDSGANARQVTILTGSAKIPYLTDPDMVKALNSAGFILKIEKTGAFSDDSAKAQNVDMVFPAGVAAATDFAKVMSGSQSFPVFETPLAIASWKPLLPVLQAAGVSKANATTGVNSFELDAAMALMVAKKKWADLPKNDVYAINRGFLVNTPDARKSATASQYIAALAYVRGGNEPPSSAEVAKTHATALSSLIARQGFQEGTLAGPFEDYLSPSGFGKSPLVLIYESQFIQAMAAGSIDDKKVLLYPNPAITLKHIAVGRTPDGKALAQFLAQDPMAQRIAARYGFRINDAKTMADEFTKSKYTAPDFVNIAVLPTSDILEVMQSSLLDAIDVNKTSK